MSPTDLPEAAYNHLTDEFHRPFFLTKLARDWNITPANAAEEEQLLDLAHQLRAIKVAHPETSQNAFLSEAGENLKEAAARLGVAPRQAGPSDAIKRAAAERLQDPNTQAALIDYARYLYNTAAA